MDGGDLFALRLEPCNAYVGGGSDDLTLYADTVTGHLGPMNEDQANDYNVLPNLAYIYSPSPEMPDFDTGADELNMLRVDGERLASIYVEG